MKKYIPRGIRIARKRMKKVKSPFYGGNYEKGEKRKKKKENKRD